MNSQMHQTNPTTSATNPHAAAAYHSLDEVFKLYQNGADALQGKNHHGLKSLSETLIAAQHSLGNVILRSELTGYRLTDGNPVPGLDVDFLTPGTGVEAQCRYLQQAVIPRCISIMADYVGQLFDSPNQGWPPEYHLQQLLPLLK